MFLLRSLRFCLLLLVISWPAAAEVDRVAVLVESTDPKLDVAALRAEIGGELGVTIVETADRETGGTLRVNVDAKTITLVYRSSSGRELRRSVARPKDAKQEREVIALLAGNLARDEALELAERLRPKSEPGAAQSGQGAPTPAESSAPSSSENSRQGKPEVLPQKKSEAKPTTTSDKPRAETEANEREALVNLSLFHPLALEPKGQELRVNLELGLVYSRVGRLEGFGLTVGSLRSDRGAQGFGVSGIWGRHFGPSDGVFASGILSTSSGRVRGVEVSGIFNLRQGEVNGVQGAGIFNHAAGKVEGLQASGITNSSNGLAGIQVAIVNVGGDVDGTQIGLVNVAGRVRGAQFGLVNVADRVDGLSFAPVSVLSKNEIRAQMFADSELPVNVGVKYETGTLYSLFTLSSDPFASDARGALGAGIGVHLWRPGRFDLSADVLYRYVVADRGSNTVDRHSTAFRLVPSFRISRFVALFAAGGVENRVDEENRAYPYGGAGAEFF